jgi:hypothetical protein
MYRNILDYGDIWIVDSTYKTNNLNLPHFTILGIHLFYFIGINGKYQNVVLATFLLQNE